MVDSGCGSVLLPLQKGQVGTLPALFDQAHYSWTINDSRGTGTVNSHTLILRPLAGTIPVLLMKDKRTTAIPAYQIPYLRFHLCCEDAIELQQLKPSFLSARDMTKLSAFVTNIASMKDTTNVSQLRKHALLGQWFLDDLEDEDHDGDDKEMPQLVSRVGELVDELLT